MSKSTNTTSSVDAAVGSLLGWVAGKDTVRQGRGPTDGALGGLLSWLTGRPSRRR